jgi:predicted NBD/HSP70 family sugar kinase
MLCNPVEEFAVAAPMNLREEGRLRVLQALYDSAAASRPELVRATGLSRATVSSLVADMIAAGFVCEDNGLAEPENRSTGRPAQPLSLNPSAAYAVGADIGHKHVRVALCDLHGAPVWDQVEVTEVDGAPLETLDLAAALIERAVCECLVPRDRILGLGVDIASPVRSDGALGADGIMPGWGGVRPGAELERRTGLAARLINDANAGALAEHRYGAGRDTDDMVYVRLSAGIGAGIVAAGRLLLGTGGLAGEIGHLPVVQAGPVCRCGNRGCLETVASPVAIARLLQDSWGQPVTPDDLPRLFASNSAGALGVLADAGEAVGRALAWLITLFNPQKIVIGGDLAVTGELLVGPVRHAIARNALPSALPQVTIVTGELGSSAEVRGAASRVLEHAPRSLAMMSGDVPHEAGLA